MMPGRAEWLASAFVRTYRHYGAILEHYDGFRRRRASLDVDERFHHLAQFDGCGDHVRPTKLFQQLRFRHPNPYRITRREGGKDGLLLTGGLSGAGLPDGFGPTGGGRPGYWLCHYFPYPAHARRPSPRPPPEQPRQRSQKYDDHHDHKRGALRFCWLARFLHVLLSHSTPGMRPLRQKKCHDYEPLRQRSIGFFTPAWL
jgi:hypothetical protein